MPPPGSKHAWRYRSGFNDPEITADAIELGNEVRREQLRLGRHLTACEVLAVAKRMGWRKPNDADADADACDESVIVRPPETWYSKENEGDAS